MPPQGQAGGASARSHARLPFQRADGPDAEPAARADSSLRDTGTQRRLSRIRPEGSGGGLIASLDAYCRKQWAPTGQVANGRWPGGAPLWWHTRASLDDGEWVPRVPAWQCAMCGEEAFPFEECGRCRPARTAPVQHGVPAGTQGRV